MSSSVMMFDIGCNAQTKTDNAQLTYTLPTPQVKGSMTVEEALANRRSRRQFLDKEISMEQLSQVLWSAYGITLPKNIPGGGYRTAPSAGATFALEIYVLAGKVKGIEPGVYKYVAKDHKIVRTIDEDQRAKLCTAAYGQKMIGAAPAVLFYSAVYSRCTDRYKERGRERYVCMDLGHSAENVYLQVEALHLGTCAVGAFNDGEARIVMQLPEEEEPLYMMPIGYVK